MRAISPMGHLPMPAASLLPSPPPQPPVGICFAGPVPQPRWKKYAQKRGHGVPRAVLKQSYKCQHPDCTAVKVTCRGTVNDGPYGLQRLAVWSSLACTTMKSAKASRQKCAARYRLLTRPTPAAASSGRAMCVLSSVRKDIYPAPSTRSHVLSSVRNDI